MNFSGAAVAIDNGKDNGQIERTNPDNRDDLVIEHLGLVKTIAARMRGNLPRSVDFDDLVQAGTLGLVDAASKYSPEKNVPFGVYAKHRIRGAILDSLRRFDHASREIRQWQKRIDDVTGELTSELQRAPEEAEVADKLDIGVERLRKTMMHIRASEQISPCSRQDSDLPEFEHPAPPATFPDSIWAHKELNGVLAKAVNMLPPRDRIVVRMHYAGGMTMRDIAKSMGVGESRVSQVHGRAIGRLGDWLRANNVTSSAAI